MVAKDMQITSISSGEPQVKPGIKLIFINICLHDVVYVLFCLAYFLNVLYKNMKYQYSMNAHPRYPMFLISITCIFIISYVSTLAPGQTLVNQGHFRT